MRSVSKRGAVGRSPWFWIALARFKSKHGWAEDHSNVWFLNRLLIIIVDGDLKTNMGKWGLPYPQQRLVLFF